MYCTCVTLYNARAVRYDDGSTSPSRSRFFRSGRRVSKNKVCSPASRLAFIPLGPRRTKSLTKHGGSCAIHVSCWSDAHRASSYTAARKLPSHQRKLSNWNDAVLFYTRSFHSSGSLSPLGKHDYSFNLTVENPCSHVALHSPFRAGSVSPLMRHK